MDEYTPKPETSGRLGPPRRDPPTAVGVLTPPPPSRREHEAPYRSSLRTRLALGFLGALAVGVGASAATVAAGPLGALFGTAIALGGVPMLIKSVRADTGRVRRLEPRAHSKRRRRAA